jgi:luciferase family oxidoreductase group 1
MTQTLQNDTTEQDEIPVLEKQVPFSVLDLTPVPEGADAATALHNTRDLAQHAEKWGYKRFWLAEHHNMVGIASAATSVVIGYVAGGTSTIRVGSGGIMLPNHAPLQVAEQFGTLESLYPGRIDLGLGRAPGTDMAAVQALRRDVVSGGETFPDDVQELQMYFRDSVPGQRVRAVPGEGLNIPIWLLGSSLFSAQLAAALGLPFAFASHFAPAYMFQAMEVYRARFKPSETLKKPHLMLAINVFAADTDREGQRLFTSLQQQFIRLRSGQPGKVPPPVDSMEEIWSPAEQAMVEQSLACAVVGSKETVKRGLAAFLTNTDVDELMITAQMYDHTARLRSFEIVSEIHEELMSEQAGGRRLAVR